MASAADAAPNPLQSELPFYLFGALLAVYAVSRVLAQRPSLVWARVHGLGSAMAHVQSVAHRGGRETTTENSQAVRRHRPRTLTWGGPYSSQSVTLSLYPSLFLSV